MWRPLLHFVWIGSLLFALDRLVWTGPPPPTPVVVTAERVEELREAFVRRTGRPPSDDELAAWVRAEVDDELLYREAIARGYLRDDPVVARRLVQNMRFAGADPERDAASLHAEALELGMQHSDPVVRRRLIQRMRLQIESRALEDPPDEEALRRFYDAHPEDWIEPARVRIVQLYFDGEPAGEARRALAELEDVGPDVARSRGDPFLHGPRQPLLSRDELAERFGGALPAAVFELPTGVWSGPVPSSYGEHLVYVQERTPETRRTFESVREKVRLAMLAERRRRALAEALGSLREGVRVVVAGDGSVETP